MSTTTIDLTIIKNKITYKFIIEDSYAFRNFSDVIAVSADFSKLLSSNKNKTLICKEDGFCSSKIYQNYDNILNNYNEQFFKMVTSQISELRVAGRRQSILINLDKRIYISEDDEEFEFNEVGKLVIQELFHG